MTNPNPGEPEPNKYLRRGSFLHDVQEFQRLRPKAIRILYMEDDPALARLVQKKLEQAGYVVDIAFNGRQGLEMYGAASYDVVAIDQSMPEYDGLEVIRLLGTGGPLPPTIMVTGSGDEAVAVEAMKLGASDYVVKDVAGGFLELLPVVVESVCEQQRLAEEREQALSALVAQKQLFENLVTVARATSERPALEDTLQNTLNVATGLTQAENGSLFLLDKANLITHRILAQGHIVQREHQERSLLVMERGLAGWVANHRQPALIADLLEDQRWLPLENGAYQARSCLAVPILSGEKLVGVLTLTHTTPGHFSQEHLHLMQAAADQIALALRNAQMYDEQRRLAQRQARLYEILRTVGGHLDPATVAHVAVEAIARVTEWTGVQLMLPDEASTHLVVQATDGVASVEVGLRQPVESGVIGRAFRLAKTQYVPDTRVDPDYVANQQATLSELAVPMRRGGRVLGVLNLESIELRAFNADDIWMAESIAETLALALDNARLYTASQWELVERKRAEEALRESEEQMRLQSVALEAAANAIVITDRTGNIIWANRALTRLTGYSLEEAIGENPRVLKSGQHPPEFYAQMWRTILSGAVWHGEVINRRKNGSLYTEEMTITPVRDSAGDITHFIAIKQDISERKRAQEELEQAKEAAEASSRAKSTFLANMGHELRTPLNAIIGYSEMLYDEFQDVEQDEFLPDVSKIRAAGLHLLGIINDILDLSKIEAGKMALELETFDLVTLVKDVATSVRPSCQKNANHLEVDYSEDLNGMYADPAKVHQILSNLLDNAAKFTEQGRIELSVEREKAETGTDWIRFRVTDTGIGMTTEQISGLFRPFTQADPSITRKYGGTGLGLSISQRLCQMMGGEILVESKLGQGSTFTVRLPAVVESLPIPDRAAAAGPRDTRAVLPGDQEEGRNVVLVIDDDPDARELIRRSLEGEDYRVITASSGEEGLRLAREMRPVAITLDVLMPVMDGWSVLEKLKADPDLADIPTFVLTILDDRQRGLAMGATEVLHKPFDSKELLRILRQHRRVTGHILIAEDEVFLRDMLRIALESAGWEVSAASNGQAALKQLAEHEPDLILLDLMMPRMNGFEFINELRQNPAWRSIPIVVITGRELTAEERQQLNQSAAQVMPKQGLVCADLLDEVRNFLHQRTRLRKEKDPAQP